jgi:protocatechuate 3,4-dioxygenase beta subunit
MKAVLKSLSPFVIGMICAGVCPGIGAGQSTTPGEPTARSANEAKSSVQGKVVQEPGGQGIRKVRVILRGGSNQGRQQFEATTDETGGFKIEGLEPGAYLVELARSGYAADRKMNYDKTTIRVVAGQDTKDLVFHMLVTGVITGKIVDADGDPLQYVQVVAMVGAGRAPRGYPTQSGRGATNDLGEYRIADLPPGKYIVEAAPPKNEAPPHSQNEKNATNGRLVYVTTYFPGTLDQRQAAAVDVSAGGTAIASFGVRSSRAYLVSGTVMGLAAQPKPSDDTNGVASAEMRDGTVISGGIGIGQLLLIGKNGQPEEQNLGEGGKFEFPNVLPGTYRAQVIVFSGFLNGQTPSMKMQTISTPIEVIGSDVVGLRLQVDKTADVTGKFHIDDDEKIDWRQLNVSLLMVPESEDEGTGFEMMEQAGMARVNEDGSFEIKDVPGANYQLAVGAGSEKFRDYYTKSVLLEGREVADTGFAAGPGTVLDVLVSAKGAGIAGTVVDEEGKPVPNAAVVTVPSTGKLGRPDAYQYARSDESGHFAVRGMNPGGFLVLAFEEMRENYRLPEFAKRYEGKGQKVELQQGGRKSVVVKLITEEVEKP